MTIQVKDQTPRDQYVATSAQTVFPYSFQIFVSGDITVEQNGTILTLATHYTLSGVADIDGGNVTLVTGATTNDIITVYRSMAYSRDTDYQNSGDFLAETVDNDYNRLWLALQQSREGVSRSLQYDVTDTFSTNLLPVKASRLNKLLGFDVSGAPVMFSQPTVATGVNTIVESIALMKALTPADGDSVFASGYYANGDGGGGNYMFNSGSSVTDNGGTVIAPNVTAGRWELSTTKALSVKQFGATGGNSSDDTAAIQACFDAIAATGGEAYIPSGIYRITSQLLIDMDGNTVSPLNNPLRVNIRGEGKGNTIFAVRTASINCLKVRGTDAATSTKLTHGYFTFSGVCFQGTSSGLSSANGIELSDIAYCTIRDCTFFALANGLVLDGSLSNNFDGLLFSDSVKGISSSSGIASGPHANVYTGCEFRQCTSLAYDGFDTLSQGVFIGCQFEGNGTHGNSATGGVIFRMTGSAGEVGPTFYGCYFEVNGGGFDVNVQETAATRISVSFYGCNFNRILSTKYVTNNIATTGEVDLNLSGCTFTSYGTYVPDAGRPYLNVSSDARVRDLGNRYEDVLEAPTTSQALPYAGWVDSAGTGETVPNGWSAARTSLGLYAVTHNLGHTNYSVVVTTEGTQTRLNASYEAATNSFNVRVYDDATSSLFDNDFAFMLVELKPIS